MTLDRQHGRLIVSCDSCDETFDSYHRPQDSDAFDVFWGRCKSEGWRAFKVGGEWEHACPKCA